ncbi:MAG TPA: hypothetical protein VI911_08960 [Patescibacteria group bacterium]|nr:MAG: hypothetical protein UR43_C0005G0040 [candidate division TM6 bacterium GW2011_GWF2_33_332]HLD91127.1 hypothetical protein [Patescibacteria group bacterium]
MKLEFTIDEKQYLNMVIKDAIQGAKNNKARNTVRYGNKVLAKFDHNNVYSELKLKELDILAKLVTSSVETLDKLSQDDKLKDKLDIISTNLKFAKQFSIKLNQLYVEHANRCYLLDNTEKRS